MYPKGANCPETKGISEHGTSTTKIRTVPEKLGCVGHLSIKNFYLKC